MDRAPRVSSQKKTVLPRGPLRPSHRTARQKALEAQRSSLCSKSDLAAVHFTLGVPLPQLSRFRLAAVDHCADHLLPRNSPDLFCDARDPFPRRVVEANPVHSCRARDYVGDYIYRLSHVIGPITLFVRNCRNNAVGYFCARTPRRGSSAMAVPFPDLGT